MFGWCENAGTPVQTRPSNVPESRRQLSQVTFYAFHTTRFAANILITLLFPELVFSMASSVSKNWTTSASFWKIGEKQSKMSTKVSLTDLVVSTSSSRHHGMVKWTSWEMGRGVRTRLICQKSAWFRRSRRLDCIGRDFYGSSSASGPANTFKRRAKSPNVRRRIQETGQRVPSGSCTRQSKLSPSTHTSGREQQLDCPGDKIALSKLDIQPWLLS